MRSQRVICVRRVIGRPVPDEVLGVVFSKIVAAQEAIMMDRPWDADARLREARKIIKTELFGDVPVEPRPRLVSLGLHRNRKPRTEE